MGKDGGAFETRMTKQRENLASGLLRVIADFSNTDAGEG